jgi:hypothetical protein
MHMRCCSDDVTSHVSLIRVMARRGGLYVIQRFNASPLEFSSFSGRLAHDGHKSGTVTTCDNLPSGMPRVEICAIKWKLLPRRVVHVQSYTE